VVKSRDPLFAIVAEPEISASSILRAQPRQT
jgi:hypothetical protein